MPSYVATVQVTREYYVPVKGKDDDDAYDKVLKHITADTWEKYAVTADDSDPDVALLEVNESDPDTDEFAKWVR